MARNQQNLIKFSAASRSRNISLVVILLLAIAIPFTVLSLQQQQHVNQNAAVCIPRPACLLAKPPCLIAEPAQGWCPTSTTPVPVACPQIVNPAKNPYSGQCINFPNPCRVPKGWVKVVSCSGY